MLRLLFTGDEIECASRSNKDECSLQTFTCFTDCADDIFMPITCLTDARFGFVTYADSQHDEDAFPTKLGEFLACGLPVISTPNSFLHGYQLDNFGIVTEGFDFEAIASGIRQAIEIDSVRWNNFSKPGKYWGHKNNWKSNGKYDS